MRKRALANTKPNPTGVVDLARYRDAVNTARWLADVLERARWVQFVRAEVTDDGEVVIAVVVEPPLSPMRRRCLPTACNFLRVEIREGTAR
jgi:hypothetical protein